jgi:hypothetical protein
MDYSVQFTVGANYEFPNVQNEMVINQTKLNTDGILEVLFNLENIGADPATDIDLAFPLGPDFGKLIDENVTIYTINPLYDLDATFTASYTVKFTAPIVGFDHAVFTIDGWYVDAGTSNPALWNPTTNYVLIDSTYLGSPVKLEIEGLDGFPQPFLDAVAADLLPHMPSLPLTASSATEIISAIDTHLWTVLNNTFGDSFNQLYLAEDKFIVDEGDFTLTPRTTAYTAASERQEWFMEANDLTLAAGAKTSLAFRINEIPTSADQLALPYFTIDETGTYPVASMVSRIQTYEEVMQYAFQRLGFDGRPISFGLEDDFSIGLDTYFANVYGSDGLKFSWKNTEGYPFFGMSNGQNLQIADDEAVVSALVSLDKQAYSVGDQVLIDVDLSNYGDVAATDLKVHLFHTRLGRDWDIWEHADRFATIEYGTLAAQASDTVSYVVDEANSFLGYHPVFAVVEFTSEAGQTGPVVPDFLSSGDTVVFEAGGETDHFVMSSLTGGLLLADSNAQAPAIPEARVTMATTVSRDGDDITYLITLKNVGTADTNADVLQTFDEDALELVSATATEGTVVQATDAVRVTGILLDPAEEQSITLEFKVISNEETTIPPAIARYTITGESSLGDTVDTGVEITLTGSGGGLLGLSASASAQQSSQKSATQDSSAAAYSASSSVGAAVNTVANTEQQTVSDGVGFIGPSVSETLGLMLVPLGLFTIVKRRRK